MENEQIKIIVVIIIIVLSIYNSITYKPVDSVTFGYNAPSLKSVVIFIATMILFIYALYLQDFQ